MTLTLGEADNPSEDIVCLARMVSILDPEVVEDIESLASLGGTLNVTWRCSPAVSATREIGLYWQGQGGFIVVHIVDGQESKEYCSDVVPEVLNDADYWAWRLSIIAILSLVPEDPYNKPLYWDTRTDRGTVSAGQPCHTWFEARENLYEVRGGPEDGAQRVGGFTADLDAIMGVLDATVIVFSSRGDGEQACLNISGVCLGQYLTISLYGPDVTASEHNSRVSDEVVFCSSSSRRPGTLSVTEELREVLSAVKPTPDSLSEALAETLRLLGDTRKELAILQDRIDTYFGDDDAGEEWKRGDSQGGDDTWND